MNFIFKKTFQCLVFTQIHPLFPRDCDCHLTFPLKATSINTSYINAIIHVINIQRINNTLCSLPCNRGQPV